MQVSLRSPRGEALVVAVLSALLGFAWQALTVHYNYHGNWTGLFCTGANQRIPRDLVHEDIFALPASYGYDGQFYHYVAHDPLRRTQLAGYMDSLQLRYRRILVPGLAFLLAAGRSERIDAAYFAVVLLCVFLGAYWLSRFARLHGRHPGWGLLFLFFPATLISVDRMTVDIALSALWAGFALYAALGRRWGVHLLLLLAPLARETGFAMTGTYCLWALWRKKPVLAMSAALTAVPCLSWYIYLRHAVGPDVNSLAALGFGGLFDFIRRPFAYPWSTAMNVLVTSSDYLATVGTVTSVALSFRFARLSLEDMQEFATVVQGGLGLALVIFGSRDTWIHVYGHARLLSPAFVLLALRALARRTWSDLTPIGLVMPRIGLQFASDALRVMRGLVSAVAG